MRFDQTSEICSLVGYLPSFIKLIGENLWRKRVLQLRDNCCRSPWGMKIVHDYHWLDMELDAIATEGDATDNSCSNGSRSLAALRFAAYVVEVHGRLTAAGRTSLEGRLRDSTKSGYAGLFLEMEMAALLMEAGYDVEFPDLDGSGNVDVYFARGGIEGEVECKSQSADAGRKIHRKDFYRFMDEIHAQLASHVQTGSRDIVHISVADRFPADDERLARLSGAVRQVLGGSDPSEDVGWFKVELLPLDSIGILSSANIDEVYAACRRLFGEQCHVAGPMTDAGTCLIVARSQQEDDTSKPLLEAMKKAAEQLSSNRPGFIAIQFNDIGPQDLILPHLRRRAAILSTYLFGSRPAAHLAAVYFCAYAGLHHHDGSVGTPGFACWNPKLGFSDAELPFRSLYSDEGFEAILGGTVRPR